MVLLPGARQLLNTLPAGTLDHCDLMHATAGRGASAGRGPADPEDDDYVE